MTKADAEATIAIEQLLYRYCHLLDRGDVEEVIDLFHREATLRPLYQGDAVYEGKEAVADWYRDFQKGEKTRARNVRHTISTPWIEVDGDAARSVCYLDVDGVVIATDEAFQLLGRYEDRLVKEAGRWWITERVIVVEGHHALGAAPGQA